MSIHAPRMPWIPSIREDWGCQLVPEDSRSIPYGPSIPCISCPTWDSCCIVVPCPIGIGIGEGDAPGEGAGPGAACGCSCAATHVHTKATESVRTKRRRIMSLLG